MASVQSGDKQLTPNNRHKIIEYWMRILLSSANSILDITNIIITFSKEHDQFDASTSSHHIDINSGGDIIALSDSHDLARWNTASAFGYFIASPGRKYEWTLQLLDDGITANLGICKSTQKNHRSKQWWQYRHGYSYFSDGSFNGYQFCKPGYGPQLAKGDIIQICLDFNQVDSDISYIVNGYDCGTAHDINPEYNYKLAIAFESKSESNSKIQLVSFVAYDYS